tara:strand:- start:3133 stop:5097 length:1965 start_codon:yes stop_codon:yes gene_type:complete
MKERIKNFRFDHGKKTYQMAWLVEYCLFAIAMSLAGFNILFGIQEGDLITGLLLSVGWAILAVIELSIIPMAGSFRLAKGWNKLFSSFGLMGLLLLSSFTVYEFNEIASEYMTRGAREAAIQGNKKNNEIQKIQNQITDLENHQRKISITRSNLLRAQEQATAAEYKRYEAEVKKTEQFHSKQLAEYEQFATVTTRKENELKQLEQIQAQIDDYQSEVSELNRLRTALIQEQTIVFNARIEPKLNQLQSRLERINETLKNLQLDKQSRIQQAQSGLFQSKEELIKVIQDEIEQKTQALLTEEATIESEISILRAPIAAPPEAVTIEQKIQRLTQLIERQISRKEAINQIIQKRLESAAFVEQIAERTAKISQLKQARQIAYSKNLTRHNQELDRIKANYASKLDSLETAQSSEITLIKNKQNLEGSIIQLQTEINQIIEAASSKYEKTMYFRMASWFMKDADSSFGTLPQKADYNTSLRYIFAPIGLFFGMTAVLLAYLGTSFMFEESRKMNPQVDSSKLIQENKLLKESQTDYDQLKRKIAEANNSKNLAISDISKRLNEKLHIAESQLQNQSELREKLDVVQNELQAEKDLQLKTRQKVATAIEAIPDSIVVLNTLRETIDRNEKDLANAKKLLLESALSPVGQEQDVLPKT